MRRQRDAATRRDRAGSEGRRAAARRLGVNWTELHRQEEAAARTFPLHDYLLRYTSGAVLTAAGVGGWRLLRGEPPSLGQLLALAAASVACAAWAGAVLVRRRRAGRASQVLYERPARRRVRDRAT